MQKIYAVENDMAIHQLFLAVTEMAESEQLAIMDELWELPCSEVYDLLSGNAEFQTTFENIIEFAASIKMRCGDE